ncbi:MAG: 2-hydroxychromene-2-carboxylate isomerase [Minwuia sp.]|uniref:2-hydroxychromene-2-carboxylate isomerase n=1 Tax=Minwuia sp. TaxID=2493630 RepID=UPI003A87B2FB
MAEMEFWFEFASTYSHIAAQTIGVRATEAGVSVRWRPFLLGPIFAAQGWRDSPFNIYPAKGAYMWRDMARECERLGVPFRHPSAFPRNGLTAARIVTAAADETWQPEFVRQVYLANFAGDREISEPEVVSACLTAAGVTDPAAWIARAGDPAVKDALKRATEEAIAAGIFGAPTFRTGGEIFWGADRLDQALAWAGRS